MEIVHRCQFMGLRGIGNVLIRFKDVFIPKENLLWKEGHGLKLALITLNTGRLTIPAGCAAGGRRMLDIAQDWANVLTVAKENAEKHGVADRVKMLPGTP